MTTKINPWKLEKELDRIGAEGVWIEYDDGSSYRIGSVESPVYKQTAEAVIGPMRAKYRNRDIPEDAALGLYNEILANAVVLDWADVVDDKGAELVYSPAAAVKSLTERPRWRAWVVQAANDRKLFIAALEEEAEKNSSSASSGPSSGGAPATNSEQLH